MAGEPLVALAAIALPLILAALALEKWTKAGSTPRLAFDRARRVIVAVGLAWALVTAAAFLVVLRPSVGGNDFFYYVCTARDLAGGLPQPLARYTYFPGVYTFWRAAVLATGGSLAALQWTVVGVLAIELVLVALVVRRVTRSWTAGAFAAVWACMLLSFLDGLEGVTEPMATVPVLAALLAWGGEPLRGRRGAWLAAGLGVGLGLAVYMKQGTGLLALGGISWLRQLVAGPDERRHRAGHLVLVALVATLVLVCGLALEREGTTPLTFGLTTVGAYVPHESFGANLTRVIGGARPIEIAFALGCVAAVVQPTILVSPRWRVLAGERWVAVVAFAADASLVTLALLAKRPYFHYLLPTGALLPIAVTIAATELARRVPDRWRMSPTAQVAALAVAAALVTHPLRHNFHFKVLPVHWPEGPNDLPGIPRRWQDYPNVSADIADLTSLVKPGEEVLVLPPSRNAVHLLLGTRSSRAYPVGYGWGRLEGVTIRDLPWGQIDAVITTTAISPSGDLQAFWEPHRSSEFVEGGFDRPLCLREDLGFDVSVRLRALVLWRRSGRAR